MSVYQPGDFVWACYDGEWFEAEIEEHEGDGVYRVYYHEYDDSVPGTPLSDIKDWKEGETEPPPDGPNQTNAPAGGQEEYYEEEEYEEEVPETEEVSNSKVVEDDGAARLAEKRAQADKALKEKKTAEAKAKADARAPTKAQDTKLYDSAKAAERRKSQKREELEKEFNFAPQLATSRRQSTGAKSSSRTSALYEHGKNKQQAELRKSASDVMDEKPQHKTKSNSQVTNRLYQAGKEREMARLQREEAEKEINQRASKPESYDARMGYDKSRTGLGQDLVTTGARTNALYHEAKMREAKKQQMKEEEEKRLKTGNFKPKLATKKSSASSPRAKASETSSRLYNDGIAKQKKLEQKMKEKEWSEEGHSFQPDISLSQRNCESSSLPGARHEALFMQGEMLRMKRDEMLDNYVDGKEVDELTFTPAVNYRYNDELLAHDTTDFTERLYRTDFAGSKQREEENLEYQDHQYEECTFAPELVSRRNDDDDEEESGSARIEKLYKDAEKAKEKKQLRMQEIEKQESSRKLTLVGKKKGKYDDEDGYKQPAHERLFSSHKKALEAKEKQASEPAKTSFVPKLFTSKKSREASSRQSIDLYQQGVEKLAAKREAEKNALPLHLRVAEEEAAKHSFKPELATKKKKKSGVSRESMNPMMMRMDSGDSVSSEMSELSVDSRRSSFSKGTASSTNNLKATKASAVRSERSAALQSKAAELLAKRAAARKEAEAKKAREEGGNTADETF